MSDKLDKPDKHLARGILAGLAGGLFASWVMNEFMAGPGQSLTDAIETPAEKRLLKQQSDGEDSTMHVADAIAAAATGGRHLTHVQRETGGPIVHYAFGALMGAVYGGLAEYAPAVKAAYGTTFGSMLFAGADLFAVPIFMLSAPLSETPPSSLATPLAAHIVYGASTELVRRLIRRVL
jgi:putative membrane protein